MNAAGDNAANSGYQIDRRSDADDASRGSDDVDDVFAPAAGADGVPMRVEGADRNWNASAQAKFFRPLRRKFSSDLVGGHVVPSEFFANASEKRIYFDQKIFRREATEGSVPEPFVAHGADAAFD